MDVRILGNRYAYALILIAGALVVGNVMSGGSAIAGGTEPTKAKLVPTEAAPTPTNESPAPAADASTTQAAEDAVLLQADTVTYDADADVVYAEGHVELAYDDRVLRADSITYYQQADKVIADGNVSIAEKSGEVIFADRIELEDKLREGVVQSFGALLTGPARISADKAVRRNGGVINELNRATYSSCDVCDDKGKPKRPLWQLRAFRVVQNRDKFTITYRDVFFEFLGVPVLYLPYFSHADPSVKRKSGLLTPSIGTSDRLGTTVEIPYYIALSPSYDVTIKPMLSAKDGLLMQTDWRQWTRRGRYDLSGSFIYTDKLDNSSNKVGEKTLRGHLFGNGAFSLNNVWSWGYQVQLVSHDTYLRRYSISNEVNLESQLYTRAISGRNYLDVSSYFFQGLRATDDPDQSPLVLPLFRGHYVIDGKKFGRLNLDANALMLQREDGIDTRRLSIGSDWQREFRTRNGQVIIPFANVRFDVYSVNDLNPGNLPNLPKDSDVIFRALPTVGIEWRWPFVRPVSKSMHVVIEPIVQAVLSPEGGNPTGIPNEDSQSFEFDTSNLFRANRASGLDLWEDGQRVNVGAKVGAYWSAGREVSFTFGRSFRSNNEGPFGRESGLRGHDSDYVASVKIKPSPNFQVTQRFRIDGDTYEFRRNEVEASFNYWRLNGSATYLSADQLSTETGIPKREELRMSGGVRLSKRWRFAMSTIRDLEIQETRQTVGSLIYEDECTLFTISAQRQFYTDRDLRPTDAILFNLVLKQLN